MVVWVKDADVPVMVIVVVPLGVLPLPPPPPPPGIPLQPPKARTPSSANPQASFLAPRRAAALAMRSAKSRAKIPRTPTGRSRGNEGELGGIKACVVMVPAEVCVPPPGGVTLVGKRVQAEFSGTPLQERATAAEKLFSEFTVTVKLPAPPAVTLRGEGETERLKSA